jgi:hypothetical protein
MSAFPFLPFRRFGQIPCNETTVLCLDRPTKPQSAADWQQTKLLQPCHCLICWNALAAQAFFEVTPEIRVVLQQAIDQVIVFLQRNHLEDGLSFGRDDDRLTVA